VNPVVAGLFITYILLLAFAMALVRAGRNN